MATREQLISNVMSMIDPSGAGQPIAAEDRQTVDDYIPFKLAELYRRRIIAIQSPDDIPDEVLQWVATHIANDLQQKFIGVPPNVQVASYADSMIIQSQSRDLVYTPTRVQYF